MVDPTRIAHVLDYSEATLRSVLAHIQASSTFSQFVYGEAELDTLLRLTTTDLDNAQARGAQNEAREIQAVLSAVTDAHNLVGEQKPREAAERLTDAVAFMANTQHIPGEGGRST